MKTLTPTKKLNGAIAILEIRQSREFHELKSQFDTLIESAKPINIIKNTVEDFTSTPNITLKIAKSLTSLATGYVSRRLLIGNSSNIFKKLTGYALQYVVTNFISKKNILKYTT